MEKYYTPSIEDLRVGYECEINMKNSPILKGWHERNITELNHITIISKEIDKFEDNIRVKYLDKEDIKLLGWQEGDTHPEGYPFWIFIKENYWLNYIPNTNDLVIMKNQEPLLYLFQGKCPSINELRIIQKLLNI